MRRDFVCELSEVWDMHCVWHDEEWREKEEGASEGVSDGENERDSAIYEGQEREEGGNVGGWVGG